MHACMDRCTHMHAHTHMHTHIHVHSSNFITVITVLLLWMRWVSLLVSFFCFWEKTEGKQYKGARFQFNVILSLYLTQEHWNSFKGNVGDASQTQGGVHNYGVFWEQRYCLVLSWIELSLCCECLSLLVILCSLLAFFVSQYSWTFCVRTSPLLAVRSTSGWLLIDHESLTTLQTAAALVPTLSWRYWFENGLVWEQPGEPISGIHWVFVGVFRLQERMNEWTLFYKDSGGGGGRERDNFILQG